MVSNVIFLHTSSKLPGDLVKRFQTVFGLNNWSTDNNTPRPEVRPGRCVVQFTLQMSLSLESRELMQSVETLAHV